MMNVGHSRGAGGVEERDRLNAASLYQDSEVRARARPESDESKRGS